MTTREIVKLIGRERFMKGLDVGEKSVERAEKLDSFTATWYQFVRQELKDLGYPEPELKLFGFRKSRVRRRKLPA